MEQQPLTMAQRLTTFASRFTPQSSRPTTPSPEDIKITPQSSRPTTPSPEDIKKGQMYKLFPKTDPTIDGEECMRDCESCSLRYPAKFSIDEEDELFGKVDKWDTHLIVATGKDDWIRDVADEQGSIMEAVGKGEVKLVNGVGLFPRSPPQIYHCRDPLLLNIQSQKMMLSASNIPVPEDGRIIDGEPSSTVLLLPAFTFIDNVTPRRVPALINDHINHSMTNTTPLHKAILASLPSPAEEGNNDQTALSSRSCPHRYLILLCSQKTRDARCGQSAPILRREFERHLRPLGLYRDLRDERPDGVGIYFISHVGGHRYSANVMIYRRSSEPVPSLAANGTSSNDAHGWLGEASQCIWLARVRPEDCENIVRYTVLQGKVAKPESQLRGGFDRVKGLVSW